MYSWYSCNQATITDAAFVHLRGIHALNMILCRQANITDTAFVQLHGIRVFNTNYCRATVKAAAATLLAEPAH